MSSYRFQPLGPAQPANSNLTRNEPETPVGIPASQLLHCEQLTEDLINSIKDPLQSRVLLLSFYKKVQLMEKLQTEFQTEQAKQLQEALSTTETFKDELYRQIQGALDTDLNCTICSLIFIKPKVLECGHTFCSFCIGRWWNVERGACPMCRKRIQREPIKQFGIDTFIKKIHSILPQEMRHHRDKVIQERKEEIANLPVTNMTLGTNVVYDTGFVVTEYEDPFLVTEQMLNLQRTANNANFGHQSVAFGLDAPISALERYNNHQEEDHSLRNNGHVGPSLWTDYHLRFQGAPIRSLLPVTAEIFRPPIMDQIDGSSGSALGGRPVQGINPPPRTSLSYPYLHDNNETGRLQTNSSSGTGHIVDLSLRGDRNGPSDVPRQVTISHPYFYAEPDGAQISNLSRAERIIDLSVRSDNGGQPGQVPNPPTRLPLSSRIVPDRVQLNNSSTPDRIVDPSLSQGNLLLDQPSEMELVSTISTFPEGLVRSLIETEGYRFGLPENHENALRIHRLLQNRLNEILQNQNGNA